MSELWICREKKAKKPFFLKEERINIYTIEELCYYLYHNIFFLKNDFLTPDLFLWIEKELSMPRLAGFLVEGINRGKTVVWCAWIILKETGYCSTEELKELQEICIEMGNKSEFECGKIKADRLLNKEKYNSSIKEYKKLLNAKEQEGSYAILIGNIYHNLGVANARLFLFSEAAEYFKKAYEYNMKQESHEAYLSALRFQQDAFYEEVTKEVEKTEEYCQNGEDVEKIKEDYKKKVMEYGTF